MQSQLNTWALLALSGAIYGFVFAVILFFQKRGNRGANKLLGVLVLLFSLRLAEFAGYWTNYLFKLPHFIFFTATFPFLFGVMLYLYARALTKDNFKFAKTTIWHFLPFLIHAVYLLPFYLQSGDAKIETLQRFVLADNPEISGRYFFIRGLQITHMLIYALLTIGLLKKGRQKINGNVLSVESINLKWLRNLTIGFGGFILLSLLHFLELWAFGYRYIVEVDYAILLSSSILIYAVGFMSLRQPEIFSGAMIKKHAPKYERSTLSEEKATLYLQKLTQAMKADKLFTNRELNLKNLAGALSISPHHLSQVLNEKLGQNFFDFVNRYRVEEAQRKLKDPLKRHFTILSIAHEVGFNNKASFNAAFKKHTGKTPSQFRESSEMAV